MTNRLTDSPACLVTEEHGPQPAPRAHPPRQRPGRSPSQKRILELNAEHPVITKLQGIAFDGRRRQVDDLVRWSDVLFDQALLAEGTMPKDPAAFAKSIADLMGKAVP